jgi:hypothetical protein
MQIQNPPQKWLKNAIAQVVGWENPDPNLNMVINKRKLPTIILGRYFCHFRDKVITSKGESQLP